MGNKKDQFNCESCYFLHQVKDKEGKLTGINECRFNPPTVHALSSITNATLWTAWPLIENPKDGWCGKGVSASSSNEELK